MDKYFVDGLRETEEDGIFRVDDDEAEFWTVYRRDHDGCGMAMFDLLFKEEAEKLVQVLEERDALLVQQQNEPQIIPNGWTNSDMANSALVMLDRIETIDPRLCPLIT